MQAAVEHIQSWNPDLVIMNGDLVNRGPSSLQVLKMFHQLRQQEGWLPIKGNHEDYVLYCDSSPAANEIDKAMRQFADWTTAQLGDSVELIRDWPDHLSLQGDESSWMHVTHGSMAGNRIGISNSISDEQLPERIPADTDLFIVSHTHKAMDRRFQDMRIVNTGSAGSPFDLDVRGSYVQVQFHRGRWEAEIVRFDYNREQTDRDFHESGFIEEGGPLAKFIYQEWKRADLMMPMFRRQVLPKVMEGHISLDAAVEEFLRDL